MNKILVIDDHTIVRQGVIRILEGMPGYRFAIDEAANEQEALLFAQNKDYDLVLLDISLQGRNGIDVLKQLKRVAPKVPVLMLSMWPAEQYAARSIRAGACGYITKNMASEELQTAVGKILNGGRYITEIVAELLVDAMSDHARQESARELLSDREHQTLCMMAAGKTMTEIAQELCLSLKTISTYRARILEKLKLRTTGEMIAYAVKNDLTAQ
jgi:DNA-binding NarL/FixJ family response regulator